MDIIKSIKKLCVVFAIVSLSVMSLPSFSNEAEDLSQADAIQIAAGININTANAELLADVLNGVGSAKAEAIVAYRDTNGNFSSIEDLALVKGIGVATVERNRSMITVN
ncbi:MAG: competence protein ComEA [Pseudomonadales bacterium]|jgi:competence protein ComEA